MKKDLPKACAPVRSKRSRLENWEREIDNYDRTIRRRERSYRNNVVHLDRDSVALISSDGSVEMLTLLNRLGPTADDFE